MEVVKNLSIIIIIVIVIVVVVIVVVIVVVVLGGGGGIVVTTIIITIFIIIIFIIIIVITSIVIKQFLIKCATRSAIQSAGDQFLPYSTYLIREVIPPPFSFLLFTCTEIYQMQSGILASLTHSKVVLALEKWPEMLAVVCVDRPACNVLKHLYSAPSRHLLKVVLVKYGLITKTFS